MFKVLMRFIGFGEKPVVSEPKPTPEPNKESGLPKEVVDEIKRFRHIQGYANSLRTHSR